MNNMTSLQYIQNILDLAASYALWDQVYAAISWLILITVIMVYILFLFQRMTAYIDIYLILFWGSKH
jgi:hypothetical protein